MSGLYSTSRKEGWRRYVDAPARTRPDQLAPAQLAALGDAAREDYDEQRKDWHANFGTVRTPQLDAAHEEIELIVDSNRQDPGEVRGAVALDALAGLGKTTIVNTFARQYDRDQIRRHGAATGAGHERIPVFRVGLTGNTNIATLNRRICEFYGHFAARRSRSNADLLGNYALDCVLSCETRLGVIDDLHFIAPLRKDGLDVTNHLKYLSSEFPITLIYAGVRLSEKGFFSEGQSGAAAVHAQSGRRWTRLGVVPFEIGTSEGRRHWRSLLKATERRLVLARAHPGMLVGLSDYVFERTTGHIASYFSLINRGCSKAIRTGQEQLNRELLDRVRIDEAAERARRELAAAFAAGRLTSDPERS